MTSGFRYLNRMITSYKWFDSHFKKELKNRKKLLNTYYAWSNQIIEWTDVKF